MKRKLILGLSMILMLMSSIPVYADADDVMMATDTRVLDDADILSEDTEEELEDKIGELIDEYNMDVAILTVEDYQEYADYNFGAFYDIADFADFFYNIKEYGSDTEGAGILLVISMAGGEGNRDLRIEIEGDANYAVNDYGSEYIMERLIDRLSNEEYDEACTIYLEDLEAFFEAYDEGEPFGSDNRIKSPMMMLKGFGIAIGVSAVLAFIIVSVMKSQMNTAKPQPYAREYVKQGSFVLTNQQDLYLYSNTTRTAKPKNTSSGGGGGSRSGSRGGGGRSGKF